MDHDANSDEKSLKGKRLKCALEKVTAGYQSEFKKFGNSVASIMIPKGAQDAYFKSKFDIGNLENTRILDVGCGFGHMLDYLQAWNIRAHYTGIDICPEFINAARQRHPTADFRLLNILDADIAETWDWVFLVGALNYATDMPLWWRYVKNMIKRMYGLCTQGVAVDFLSSYVDFKKENSFHPKPEKVFSFAKTITRRVALRHDYMPYSFTVYLYRNQDLTDNNIFLDYKKNLPPEVKL
jgi:SAM-dependent methyltransferase